MIATQGLRFDPKPLQKAFILSGLTYKALGNRIPCSSMVAHNCVSGKNPTSRFMRRVAEVLGVDLQDCWKDKRPRTQESRP